MSRADDACRFTIDNEFLGKWEVANLDDGDRENHTYGAEARMRQAKCRCFWRDWSSFSSTPLLLQSYT